MSQTSRRMFELAAAGASRTAALRQIRTRPTLGSVAQISYLFDVTATEQNILNALIDLDNAAKLMPTANPKPNLLPLFARIDELTRQLPPQTDPDLLHYLHKKSYEKARLFLEGRDSENAVGNCRHV